MSKGEDLEDLSRRLLKAHAEGQSYRAIARGFGMTEARARKLIKEEADRVLSAEALLLDRAESMTRMRELEVEFFK